MARRVLTPDPNTDKEITMKFNMPTASRKRLEELLEYLGDRADDFKKCFDIESEWCWKYADLVLRGLEKRKLRYSEGHHAVPASFYGKRCCNTVDTGNLFTLSYAEHVWAHYCACYCATGKMQGKMARAFITMYNVGMSGRPLIMPSESEFIDAIPEMELRRIRAMEPRWAKVEAEGRTHKSEDPKQYNKDYYEANKEKIDENNKVYYEENKDKIAKQKKAYQKANKEKIAEQKKAYQKANKEKIDEKNKVYYAENKDKIAKQKKAYQKSNKEKIAERKKARYEANKENILKQKKAYNEANKEKRSEYMKSLYDAKVAAGYRKRKNPLTGKHEWVFVGLPESPKSTEAA